MSTATAIELFHEDGRTAGVWYCSECRVVHRTLSEATGCHGTLLCKTEGCEKEVGRSRRHIGLCDDCDNKVWKQRVASKELERYEKAEKIPAVNYDGPVFCDGLGCEWFESLQELLEYAEDEELPDYAWASKNVGVPKADLEDITGNMLDNMWEEADESDLNGIPELQAALDAFNEANKSVTVRNVDYSRAIVIRGEV